MSVSTETNKVTYDCSGGTTYEITFDVLLDTGGDAEQIKVIRTTAAGVESELTVTTEWTISGTTVTTVATYSDGKITLARDMTLTQTVDHQYGGILDADVLDRAFDKLTMINQQQTEQLARVVKVPITESGDMTLPTADARANLVLGFDASGDPIAAAGVTAAATAFMQTVLDDATKEAAQTTLGLRGLEAKSADYTILDTDVDVFEVTTGASNRTLTLPTLANNQGRVITLNKVDSGAGTMILDGEGAETIGGLTTATCYTQGAVIVVRARSAEWEILAWTGGRPIANAVRVVDEFQLTEDNELDYSSSFIDGMAAATVTFAELPSNTKSIHLDIYVRDSSTNPYIAYKRTSGGTQGYMIGGLWADGGDNLLRGTYWIPTGGNSIYVTAVQADVASNVKIIAYKVGE